MPDTTAAMPTGPLVGETRHAPGRAEPNGIRTLSLATLVMAIIQCLGLFVFHIMVVPRFFSFFNEFGTELPWLTIQALLFPKLAALVLCLLVIALLIVKELPRSIPTGTKLLINVCVIMLGPVLFFLYFLALWLPLRNLIYEVM